MRATAIVPAYNEEANIGNVLRTLFLVRELEEIIVVDDGSTDKTGQISENLGARVIKVVPNQGKGEAMRKGVMATKNEIIVFFDADLVGLKPEHILSLLKPVAENEAAMVVGVRERGRWKGKLARFLIKIDPLLAIGGERAMKRFIFESLPQRLIKGFEVETILNYYCLKKKLKVLYVDLKGLDIVIKERKHGFLKGFVNRLKMIWQLLKIRALLIFGQKEFE